jgi:hypothetical protein
MQNLMGIQVAKIPVRTRTQMAEVVGFVVVGLPAAQCLMGAVVVGVGAQMEFEVEATTVTGAVAVEGVWVAATRS